MNVSAAKSSNTTPSQAIDPTLALLFGVVLFATSVRSNSPTTGIAVLVATGFVTWVAWKVSRDGGISAQDNSRLERRLLTGVIVLAVLGVMGWAPSAIGPTHVFLERVPGVAWATLAVFMYASRRSQNTRPVLVGIAVATVVLTLLFGIRHLGYVDGLGLDVNFLHIEAAEAIANGENPYTDSVIVPDGAPTAEPADTITGYPYPPVTAIAYSAGQWIFGEPRVTSLIAWVVVLGLIGLSAIRNRDRHTLYVMLLIAAIPGWPLVLRAGWTEPLSLAFLAAAFFFWHLSTTSGLALGLGLASKQYFVVTAPIALFHRDQGWRRRLITAVLAIGVTLGLALVLDFSAFWSAAVEFHTSTPPRPDSSNVVGLLSEFGIEWAPPAALSFAVGLVVGIAVGRLSSLRSSFSLIAGTALGASFLVSSQAFANYWFLVTGLCALSLVAEPNKAPT